VVLSKRERYIGIGAIAAVVLLGISELVVGPYYDSMDALQKQETAAKKTLDANQHLFRLQKDKQTDWSAMMRNGLEADDSTARTRTQQRLQTWARDAGINLDALSSDSAPSQKGSFQAINFSLDFNTSGADSMRQIAKFLQSVESATIPVRLNNIRIQSTKEGTDQLNVKLVVSALYMPPTGQSADVGNDVFNALGVMP
jgi:hypothetical protein